ncbi:MAG: sugar transferase [Ignavibacteria bacterium]|nr:sugar transferase [Ignavibacteria bacterium]
MKKKNCKYVLLLLDWVVVNFAFVVAIRLQAPPGISALLDAPASAVPEFLLFVAYSGIMLLVFQINELYKINIYLSVNRHIQQILKSLLYSVIGLSLVVLASRSDIVFDGRLVVIYFFLASFVLMITTRILIFRTILKLIVANGLSSRLALIAGAGPTGKRLASSLNEKNPFGLRPIGFLDDNKPVGSVVLPGIKVLGNMTNAASVVEEFGVNEIVLCLENEPDDGFLEKLDLCAKTKASVTIGSEQFEIIPQRMYQESYGDVPLFGVVNSAPYLGQPALKRLGDLILATLGLIILSPLFLLVAIAIKLDSPGPVLFKQTRIGKDGKPFTFYKFRSMNVGSDKDRSREEKLRRFIQENKNDVPTSTKIVDHRKITRVGRFLRKISIDELPQLINVLKGDMSLVGPRPCLPYEWKNYAEWHKRRLSVTPGCTGVWQVLGRSKVGFRDMVILDLFYVHNVSFHLDVLLIFKTIPAMLLGIGGK